MTERLCTIQELAARYRENNSTVTLALQAVQAKPAAQTAGRFPKALYTDRDAATALLHLYHLREDRARGRVVEYQTAQDRIRKIYGAEVSS